MLKSLVVISLFFLCSSGVATAEEFTLSIQPILPKSEIVKAYTPLAEYLSSQTGHTIKIKAHSNFITYWADMKRNNGFDLVLDAAHFTNYRLKKKNYELLARLPDTVSFTLVTHEDEIIFDADELVLKRVATLVSPSVGALRLLDLFTDPFRQPQISYAKHSNDAAQKVLDKKVFAAIIPTALVNRYEGLNSVLTTKPLPHMAFSASPDVPAEVSAQIKKALLEARNTGPGQDMLAKINLPGFEQAEPKMYEGFDRLLKNVMGY